MLLLLLSLLFLPHWRCGRFGLVLSFSRFLRKVSDLSVRFTPSELLLLIPGFTWRKGLLRSPRLPGGRSLRTSCELRLMPFLLKRLVLLYLSLLAKLLRPLLFLSERTKR